MQAKLQRIERLIGDDQLAVEDEALDGQVARRVDDLGEVAPEGTLAARLQFYCVGVAEQDAAEAVVFRLEQPAVTCRQIINRNGFHRLEREGDIKGHGGLSWGVGRYIASQTLVRGLIRGLGASTHLHLLPQDL